MTNREAQEIIRMVEDNWHTDLGTARSLWRDALMPWSAEVATRAVAQLATTHRGRYLPLNDLVEVIHAAVAAETGLPPGQAVNQAADVECSTCDGDRFVVVGSRPALQTEWMRSRGIAVSGDASAEEWAGCPECNPKQIVFRRYDGEVVSTPDAGKTREMITR